MKQIYWIPPNQNYTPWGPNSVAFELFFSHKLAPLKSFIIFEPLIFDQSGLVKVRTDVDVPDGFSRLIQVWLPGFGPAEAEKIKEISYSFSSDSGDGSFFAH